MNSLMKNDNKIDKDSVGLASGFYVMAKLISLGFQTSLTFGHTKSLDIHASKKSKTYSIQVKGAQNNKQKANACSWRISKNKIENNVLYIFVNLNLRVKNNRIDYYLIYGLELAKLIKGKDYIYSNKLLQYMDKWP